MKFLKLFLVFVLAFNLITTTYAKPINQISQTTTVAKVLKIIDGDTMQVELPNKDTAYVKLKGVTSKGFDQSYDYLTNTLLGQNVTLQKDKTSYNGGKFNYMVVYYNGININNQLLQSGLAVIDNTQDKGYQYDTLVQSQNIAKTDLSGMWLYEDYNYSSITGENGATIIQTDDKVNINTATKDQLRSLLKGVGVDLANEIVKYRDKNPFNTIQEIKFVKGFTKKMYDDNKHIMTVSTNINKANTFELKTLNNLSDQYIDDIINKRSRKDFSDIKQLADILEPTDYSKISYFISTEDKTSINIIKGADTANVSLSSKSYLTKAGASSTFASDIVSYRKNGYTYKTLMELMQIGSNVTEQELNYLQDNLELYTNVASNNIDYLMTVFTKTDAQNISKKTIKQKEDLKSIISESKYEQTKDAIYVDTNKDEYINININTATKEQMYEQGFSTDEAYKLIQKRPIRNATQFPFNVSKINNKISLYTNINTASRTELKSLNNGMTDLLIDKIIKYRQDEGFATLDEIKQFFESNNALNTFNAIKSYLVVR